MRTINNSLFIVWEYLPVWAKRAIRWIMPSYLKLTTSFRTFTFEGEEYRYFFHPYNSAWGKERAIEIPLALKFLQNSRDKRILEVGNVLSHYQSISHDVIDKYETAEGVINEDIVDYQPDSKYDRIFSISTLEHVGWDEEQKRPSKAIDALEKMKSLLSPDGSILVTILIGYNNEIDRFLREGKLRFNRTYYLKRLGIRNRWQQAPVEDIRYPKTGYPSRIIDQVVIGIIDGEDRVCDQKNSGHWTGEVIRPKGDCFVGYFRRQHGITFSANDVSERVKWFNSQYRFISSKIQIQSSMSVLEVGSGLGGLLAMLPPEVDYTGLELDEEAVEFTQNYYSQGHFLNIPLASFNPYRHYDLVFAIEVLEHLKDPLAGIVKINELLSPGGVFCGTSPYPFRWNVESDETHLFVLNPENWKKLFVHAGFENVQTYPMSFLPLLWRINKRLNPVLPFYLPIPRIVSTTLILARKAP